MSCGCGIVVRGATGLAKVALQSVGVPVDMADPATVQSRRDACRKCEHASRNHDPRYAANQGLTTFSRCGKCSCVIAAKTRLASERCPDGKW
jgi:hypothetical protein